MSQKLGRETVLRGGFGIFYDLGSGSVANAASSFPYARNKTFSNVPFPLTAAQAIPLPFTLNIPTSGNASVSDPNLKLPRTYEWNFTVEQALGSKQIFSASYVAAAGRRLLRQTVKSFPSSLSVNFTQNTATSDYHALQLQFRRRLSSGVQALASYAWSHSIDIASNDSFNFNSPISPRLDRGSSDFDVRHAFNAAVTYDLPAPRLGAVAGLFFKDWSVDTIVAARSATPVDLIGGFDFTGGFTTAARPDVISGIPLYINDPSFAGGRRFNRAAFAAAPAGRQGTLGRDVLRGFPVFQVDLALQRRFKVTERVNLQLRSEFFNLFNHPNFGDPGGNQGNFLSSPLFGQSTSMLGRSLGSGGSGGGFSPLYQIGGPRSIQLSVKLVF